jgi:hypothetical protein
LECRPSQCLVAVAAVETVDAFVVVVTAVDVLAVLADNITL